MTCLIAKRFSTLIPPHILKVAVAQLNPIVGDIEGNLGKARHARQRASDLGADIIIFNELFLSGAPPEDLMLNTTFQERCREACKEFALETVDGGAAVLMGTPWMENGHLLNSVLLMRNGDIEAVCSKTIFSANDVFGEKKAFYPAGKQKPITLNKVSIGLALGADLFDEDVVTNLIDAGAEIILSPQAAIYWRGHFDERKHATAQLAQNNGLPIALVNCVGGQDDVVFDGASFVINADGSTAAQLPAFQESFVLTTWEKSGKHWNIEESQVSLYPTPDQADYTAAMVGLRDYAHKSGFQNVVLGMSGGIDSALVATLAADALGADNVFCVMLPSQFTSQSSFDDAKACAQNLGARYEVLSITPVVEGVESSLSTLFEGHPRDLTEENIQARSRGLLLMAISNKFGNLLLSTGNKSEGAVGYATLYGDMCGGFNPITDLYKTRVFKLCEVRNTWKPEEAKAPDGEVIPKSILTKAPSAELRENQKDQDSLPPYDVLDDILIKWIENKKTVAEIAASGHELAIVKKVVRLVHIAEYKRRQAVFGPKLTKVSFNRDRHSPVVHHFKG